MGNRNAPKEKPVYTEKSIQKRLRMHFMSPGAIKYRIENLSVYSWESDSLSVTRSGYAYECEIKITKADFNNDKKKVRKHQILEGTYVPKNPKKPYPARPNYFLYVVPEGLITKEDLPPYAGLIYINEIWPYVHVEVQPPKIHGEKIDEEALKFKDKFYYNYIAWKYKAETEYEETINNLRRELHESKYDEDGNYHKLSLAEANQKVKLLEDDVARLEKHCDEYYKMYTMQRNIVNHTWKFMTSKGIDKEEIRKDYHEYVAQYDENNVLTW